jgi:hypothetical protein
LARQPTLGPYFIQSATPYQIVLLSDPQWTINYNRYREVIISSSEELPPSGSTYYVKYAPVATESLVANLVAHPRFLGQFGNASDVEELTFSPHSTLAANRSVRAALSWLLNRRAILNGIFGSFTLTPSVPTSALFSQGQVDYPLASKQVAPTSYNWASVDPSQDCRTCALAMLRNDGYVDTARGWRDAAGTALHLKLAMGPTPLDHRTADTVARQWTALGLSVSLTLAASDAQAAAMSSGGRVDAAVFDRPTSTTAWVSARSWDEKPYVDSYSSGVRSAATHKLFTLAQGTFNPATAALTWLKIDHRILTEFWVRPLYTVPSLTEWSGPVANVVPSLSLSGLVDQVTNWGISLPSTSTTSKPSTSPVG